MNEITRALWAKSEPYHPLWKHLLDVAASTRALLGRFAPAGEVPAEWVCYINALHDIGKADEWFQNKHELGFQNLEPLGVALSRATDATSDNCRLFRHEARSGEWLRAHLKKRGWGLHALRVVEKVVLGHHGNFSPQHFYTEEEAQKNVWNPLREELAAMLRDELDVREYSPERFDDASTTGMTWSGLLILADWIASNDELLRYSELQHLQTPREYSQATLENARRAVALLGFEKSAPPAVAASFASLWPQLKTLHPAQTALQTLLSQENIAPGLALIEEQMGRGKTETAILLAEHWNAARGQSGAYLALPTQATGNQMHRRYRAYLHARRPGDEVRLVHGMAWLLDEKTPENAPQTSGENAGDENLAREWFRPLRRALLASDGVGTVDQVLMAALHVKFGPLRFLGLRSKVLVIDECHAYDAYMSSLLHRLLEWCRALDVPVILLTATLSKRQKTALLEAYGAEPQSLPEVASASGYPLFTFVDTKGAARAISVDDAASQPRRVALQKHCGILNDAERIARLALRQIENGGCGCVLMNTVKGAQDVFRAVRCLIESGEYSPFQKPEHCTLFHARFRAEKRTELEERIEAQFGKDAGLENGARPQRALVVATQVIEQSLDVDFDVFLSQIAPIDLLLQRSGREWRHPRENRPMAECVFHVLLPELEAPFRFGTTEKVYAREVLLRTAAVLHGIEEFVLPRDFRALIEAVYDEKTPSVPFIEAADLEAATQANRKKIAEEEQLSNAHKLAAPSADVFPVDRASTRESPETEGANPLRASTRLGNESRPALLLHDAKQQQIAAKAGDFTPPRETMQAMFLQKTNVPAWWLHQTTAAVGHENIVEGEGWLRFHAIVPLRGGEWRRADGARIADDETLGVFFETPNKSDTDEEADAGTA